MFPLGLKPLVLGGRLMDGLKPVPFREMQHGLWFVMERTFTVGGEGVSKGRVVR